MPLPLSLNKDGLPRLSSVNPLNNSRGKQISLQDLIPFHSRPSFPASPHFPLLLSSGFTRNRDGAVSTPANWVTLIISTS